MCSGTFLLNEIAVLVFIEKESKVCVPNAIPVSLVHRVYIASTLTISFVIYGFKQGENKI